MQIAAMLNGKVYQVVLYATEVAGGDLIVT